MVDVFFKISCSLVILFTLSIILLASNLLNVPNSVLIILGLSTFACQLFTIFLFIKGKLK
jgi:hypothetical protein